MTLATNILLYIQTMTRDDNENYWKNKLHLMYSICACNLQSICIPHAVINKTFISNFESVQDWVGVACHHCGIVPVRIKCNMVSSYQNHIRISTRRKLLTDFIRRISNHAFSYFMITQNTNVSTSLDLVAFSKFWTIEIWLACEQALLGTPILKRACSQATIWHTHRVLLFSLISSLLILYSLVKWLLAIYKERCEDKPAPWCDFWRKNHL